MVDTAISLGTGDDMPKSKR